MFSRLGSRGPGVAGPYFRRGILQFSPSGSRGRTGCGPGLACSGQPRFEHWQPGLAQTHSRACMAKVRGIWKLVGCDFLRRLPLAATNNTRCTKSVGSRSPRRNKVAYGINWGGTRDPNVLGKRISSRPSRKLEVCQCHVELEISAS